jgi:hypothetical protein
MKKKFSFIILFFSIGFLANGQSFNNRISFHQQGKDLYALKNWVADTATTFKDTSDRNMYGNLVTDDPEYNKRYPLYVPFVTIVGTGLSIWAFNRYVMNEEWARVNSKTIRSNLNGHWEWDYDRFGINFIGHPYSGNLYFNCARANFL